MVAVARAPPVDGRLFVESESCVHSACQLHVISQCIIVGGMRAWLHGFEGIDGRRSDQGNSEHPVQYRPLAAWS